MTRHLRVVYYSALLHLRLLATESFAMVVMAAWPILLASVSIYMLRHRPDFEVSYVVVGTTLSGLWSQVLLFGSNIVISDRFSGRLEYLAASPAPLFASMGGRMLGFLVYSLISAVVSYGTAAWLFGYPLTIHHPLAFSISAILTLASLWATGMVLAPLSFLWIAFGRYLTGLEFPLYILCGFLFPITLLPAWLHPVSYALPPFWGAAALHGASSGDLRLEDLVLTWLLVLFSCVGAVLLSRWLFSICLARSRREGLLGAV